MSAATPVALVRAVAPIRADDHEVCVKIALPWRHWLNMLGIERAVAARHWARQTGTSMAFFALIRELASCSCFLAEHPEESYAV
jgi:hypothetical protein